MLAGERRTSKNRLCGALTPSGERQAHPAMLASRIDLERFMAGRDEHIKPLRLLEIARNSGARLSDKEDEHLRECEQCQGILELLTRQLPEPPNDRPEDAA